MPPRLFGARPRGSTPRVARAQDDTWWLCGGGFILPHLRHASPNCRGYLHTRRAGACLPPSPTKDVATYPREPSFGRTQTAFPGGGRCLGTRRMRRPAENAKRQQKKGKVELAFYIFDRRQHTSSVFARYACKSTFPRWGRLRLPSFCYSVLARSLCPAIPEPGWLLNRASSRAWGNIALLREEG